MIAVDWGNLALGGLAGVLAGVLFFAGLALGMSLALRTPRLMAVLALSATFRMAALLGFGWLVAGRLGATALAGYALAFMLVRFVAVTIARRPARAEVR